MTILEQIKMMVLHKLGRSSDKGTFTDPDKIWKMCKCLRAKYVYATKCPLCITEKPQS